MNVFCIEYTYTYLVPTYDTHTVQLHATTNSFTYSLLLGCFRITFISGEKIKTKAQTHNAYINVRTDLAPFRHTMPHMWHRICNAMRRTK